MYVHLRMTLLVRLVYPKCFTYLEWPFWGNTVLPFWNWGLYKSQGRQGVCRGRNNTWSYSVCGVWLDISTDLEWHQLLSSLIWDVSMWMHFLYHDTKTRQMSWKIFRKLSWKSILLLSPSSDLQRGCGVLVSPVLLKPNNMKTFADDSKPVSTSKWHSWFGPVGEVRR